MTRETKVGMLVGMGVILLIGIIVSDQLSHIQQQQPADLTDFAGAAQQGIISNELASPPSQHAATGPAPVGLPPREAASDMPESHGITAEAPVPERQQASTESNDLTDRLVMNIEQARRQGLNVTPGPVQHEDVIPVTDRASAPPSGAASVTIENLQLDQQATPVKPQTHTVVAGDSLYRIAEKYLGDGNRWHEIANANPGKVGEDGQIQLGVKLTIPAAQTNHPAPARNPNSQSPALTAPNPKLATQNAKPSTYTVKSGDSLYRIAQTHLGNGSRWHEIANANPGKVGGDGEIQVGQTLKIPG